MSAPRSSQNGPPAPLDKALGKNRAVAAEVQRASDDLSVINTVLEQELPDEVQVGDVAQALEHTGRLEKKLAESAETLDEVNTALAEEIEKRKKAEAALRGAAGPSG